MLLLHENSSVARELGASVCHVCLVIQANIPRAIALGRFGELQSDLPTTEVQKLAILSIIARVRYIKSSSKRKGGFLSELGVAWSSSLKLPRPNYATKAPSTDTPGAP